MPRDVKLEDDVRTTLGKDTRIPSPADIAVVVEDRTVTLRGTVGSFRVRHAVLEDVKALTGVDDVVDDITVNFLTDPRDEQIRGRVLQTLLRDSRLAQSDIDVHVRSGWITLTGRVSRQADSDAAFSAAAGIHDAGGITSRIVVSAE